MKKYIHLCAELIATADKLYKEYGTREFKVKYFILKILDFTAIGVVVGLTIGVALPFLSINEACVGGGVGAVVGLGFATYELVWEWKEKMNDIKNMREHMQRIRASLIEVEQQLQTAYTDVAKTKLELKDQIKHISYLTVQDLHRYIIATYDQFVNLQNILSQVNLVAEND